MVSVDTKKKELVGEFSNGGRERQPKGRPEKSLVHDFPQDSAGKAIPYGIYDMGRNEAFQRIDPPLSPSEVKSVTETSYVFMSTLFSIDEESGELLREHVNDRSAS